MTNGVFSFVASARSRAAKAEVLTPMVECGNISPSPGGVAEWLNAPVSKTGVPQGTEGSNPSASVGDCTATVAVAGRSTRFAPGPPIVYNPPAAFGEVAEWLKAQHWKCCLQQCNAGSNPVLSVFPRVTLAFVEGYVVFGL